MTEFRYNLLWLKARLRHALLRSFDRHLTIISIGFFEDGELDYALRCMVCDGLFDIETGEPREE